MIIAFTGKLGSGKDAAGERMVNLVDLPSRRVSFAASLKESAAALLDIPVEDWEGYKNDPDVKVVLIDGYSAHPLVVVKDYTDDGEPLTFEVDEPKVIREFTAREFLQRYGTEAHRSIFGSDFWVEQAVKQFPIHYGDFVYITDCRFENEAKAIKRAGGYIARVVGANESTGTHVSESGLPDDYITFEIDNTVRDDNFLNLDLQLADIARTVGLPVREDYLAQVASLA